MADNIDITPGSGKTVLTDETGSGHAQVVKQAISTDGSATLIPADAANGLDVDVTRVQGTVAVADSALATALASLLTELGQKVEPADLSALATASKQDTAKAVLDTIASSLATIVSQTDGLEATITDVDLNTDGLEASLTALFTELGQKLEAGDITGLATAAKQDTAQTTLASILTSVDGAEALLTAIDGHVDGLEGKDYATQTTLAAILAKIIAAPATEAKQDTTITAINAVTTAVEELAEVTEVQPVSDNGGSLTVDAPLGTPVATRLSDGTSAIGSTAQRLHVQVATELPAGTQNIGDVDIASSLPAGTNAIGKLAANSGVDIGDVDVTSLPAITQPNASSATVTQVASSASSVTLQASNASRKGLTIYNDSTQALYVKFGTTASATSFTVKIPADGYYEMPVAPVYTGRVDAIWAAANGNAYVTEM